MPNPYPYPDSTGSIGADARPVKKQPMKNTSARAKDKAKDRRLMRLYRITLAEQKKIERFQKEHPCYRVLLGRNMGTDHRHSDGLVRGRLDWRINKAYGLLEKVAQGTKLSTLLMALALYTDAPPAVEALGGPRYGLIGQARVKKNMVYGGKP